MDYDKLFRFVKLVEDAYHFATYVLLHIYLSVIMIFIKYQLFTYQKESTEEVQ